MATSSQKASPKKKPFKRTAYFISGLHAFGFEHFWPILRKGAQQHGRIYPRKIDIEQTGEWNGSPEVTLTSKENGARDTITTYRYMKWNDLVTKRMEAWYHLEFFKMFFLFMKSALSGELYKLYRYYWGFGNTALYVNIPVFTIIILFILLGITLHGSFGWTGVLLTFIVSGIAIEFARLNEKKLHIQHYYHLLKLRIDWPNGKEKELENRIDKFSDQLADALLNDDADELLVIAHSYGTLVAVDSLAKALDKVNGKKLMPKKIGLVTAGAIHHCVAMRKNAHAYRKSLATVGGDKRIYWLEPFSPQDGANFPKCNPVTDFTNVDPAYGPHQKSIKYRELVTPKTYKRNKLNFWRMHFQYLYEGEIPGDYSFFRILCSDQPLENNYGYRENPDKETPKGEN